MKGWISRLAFTFAVAAALLWWSAYKQSQSTAATSWREWIEVVAGALSAGLAIVGVRIRHRQNNSQSDIPME